MSELPAIAPKTGAGAKSAVFQCSVRCKLVQNDKQCIQHGKEAVVLAIGTMEEIHPKDPRSHGAVTALLRLVNQDTHRLYSSSCVCDRKTAETLQQPNCKASLVPQATSAIASISRAPSRLHSALFASQSK